MDAKKSNKIRDIVRLQQLLKKWRKKANSSKSYNHAAATAINTSPTNTTSKSIKFLKRTLSLTENTVPKGCLAVCVGEEQKRFVIPMEYLGHQAFQLLLREAEEEFGFQQTGVLRIPCEVSVFESILKIVEQNKDLPVFLPECRYKADDFMGYYTSVGSPLSQSHHPQSPLCM